ALGLIRAGVAKLVRGSAGRHHVGEVVVGVVVELDARAVRADQGARAAEDVALDVVRALERIDTLGEVAVRVVVEARGACARVGPASDGGDAAVLIVVVGDKREPGLLDALDAAELVERGEALAAVRTVAGERARRGVVARRAGA